MDARCNIPKVKIVMIGAAMIPRNNKRPPSRSWTIRVTTVRIDKGPISDPRKMVARTGCFISLRTRKSCRLGSKKLVNRQLMSSTLLKIRNGKRAGTWILSEMISGSEEEVSSQAMRWMASKVRIANRDKSHVMAIFFTAILRNLNSR